MGNTTNTVVVKKIRGEWYYRTYMIDVTNVGYEARKKAVEDMLPFELPEGMLKLYDVSGMDQWSDRCNDEDEDIKKTQEEMYQYMLTCGYDTDNDIYLDMSLPNYGPEVADRMALLKARRPRSSLISRQRSSPGWFFQGNSRPSFLQPTTDMSNQAATS